MEKIKKFIENANFVLHSFVDRIVLHYHVFGSWDSLFILSSAFFLVFWIFAQGLGDTLNQKPFLPEFLCGLGIALGIGCWIYFAVVYLFRRSFFRNGLGEPVWMFTWICIGVFAFLMPLSLILESSESVMNPKKYFDEENSQSVLVSKLVDNSRFFGHGDSIFIYSDELAAGYSAEDPDSLPFEVQQAYAERHEANSNLAFFRDEKMLAVLSYAYGSWIVFSFAIIAVIWCISAIRIYMKIYSRWYEWVFFGSFLLCAYQMLLPVLVGAGIMPYREYLAPFAFASGESVSVFLIPLASMLAIVKVNNEVL